jgi:hypothetical protein
MVSRWYVLDGDDKGYIELRRSPKQPEPSLVTRFPRAGNDESLCLAIFTALDAVNIERSEVCSIE